MKTKVTVDQNKCIGSGNCIVLASQFFDLNDEGKAEIKAMKNNKLQKEAVLDLKEKDLKKVLAAAKACPAQAISVTDENGKDLYP